MTRHKARQLVRALTVLLLVGLALGMLAGIVLRDSPPVSGYDDWRDLEWEKVNPPRADMECWVPRGWDVVVCRW